MMMMMMVNENKTKYLICTSEERNTFNQLKIGDYEFEKTFKYLGSLLTANSNISAKIQPD
jgi:hypothetical protein